MSITRIGPVRVVGQSLLAVVGPVPFSVTPTPLQTVQQRSAQEFSTVKSREYGERDSLRSGPALGRGARATGPRPAPWVANTSLVG